MCRSGWHSVLWFVSVQARQHSMTRQDQAPKPRRDARAAAQIDHFRDRISHHDALPQMVLLGVLSGLAAALLIVAFRWLIDTPLGMAFGANVDNFESLPPLLRFLVPFAGALLLGIVLSLVKTQHHAVSVSHVLERLHNNQGKMPAANIVLQFFGGIVALASGQSVGKEGPSIHLGAGIASQLGQYFKLPNNALRTLVACGAAAGIAASFNTPMAGVVFAMEVILMEYTIVGFIPVILASVLGATINQLVFGTELSFVSVGNQGSLVTELPFMILSGAIFAVCAATFIRVHLWCLGHMERPVWQRYLLIGFVTGGVAVYLPEILGSGYDTLNLAMSNSIDLQLLLLIVIAKLLVTAIATGLGMVGGIIGPTLMMGGCLGAILGWVGNTFASSASEPGFYVVLGMVAMMGAILNAPLAALIAILELSHNPGILFPAMLLVVVACLGVQLVFSYEGIFAEQLKVRGHDLFAESGKGFLSRVGVRSVMDRSLRISELPMNAEELQGHAASPAVWLVLELEDEDEEAAENPAAGETQSGTENDESDYTLNHNYSLLATAELAKLLESSEWQSSAAEVLWSTPEQIPVRCYDVALIDSLATLREASLAMRQTGAEALLVIATHAIAEARVLGIITRDTLSNYHAL